MPDAFAIGLLPYSILLTRAGSIMQSFTTLALAKAAAVSGDTIQVGPGTYTVTSNLFADGIAWQLDPDAVLSGSGMDMFSDAGGAGTCTVAGSGSIVMTDGNSAVRISNPASAMSVACRSLLHATSGSGALISSTNGSLSVTADSIVTQGSSYPLYWENGPCHVTAKVIRTAGQVAVYCLCNRSVAPTGQWYITVQDISSASSGGGATVQFLTTEGGSPQYTYRAWLYCSQISGPTTTGTAYQTADLNTYIIAQKIIGNVAPGGGAGAGKHYLTVQKIAGRLIFQGAAGTRTWANIGQFDDALLGEFEAPLRCETGVAFLTLLTCQRATIGDAVRNVGGTINLLSGIIGSQNGYFDLNNSGGTLNVLGGSGSGTNGAFTSTGTITYPGPILSPIRGGTGTANNAANTLGFSGNFGLTLTLTGVTAVTLPTSGTLATTGQLPAAAGTSGQVQISDGAGGFAVGAHPMSVNPSTGAVTTRNNTLDDGSGGAIFASNVAVGNNDLVFVSGGSKGIKCGTQFVVSNPLSSIQVLIDGAGGGAGATLTLNGNFGQINNGSGSFFISNDDASGDIIFRPGGDVESARFFANGTTKFIGSVGFNGTTPVAKPTITGSRGGNVALATLLTALAATGLLTDSTI